MAGLEEGRSRTMGMRAGTSLFCLDRLSYPLIFTIGIFFCDFPGRVVVKSPDSFFRSSVGLATSSEKFRSGGVACMQERYEDRDPDRPALGIQQPWVELILQGKKRLEVRSLPTRIRGRIYLYASKSESRFPEAVPYLNALRKKKPLSRSGNSVGHGQIVGSVELINCRLATEEDALFACVNEERLSGQYVWELAAPNRFHEPWPVTFLPYGLWFYPWKRKGE